MTATLERAFEKVGRLTADQQEDIARMILDKLELLDALQEGIDAADRGAVVSVEEVRQMIPAWITESSSPNQR